MRPQRLITASALCLISASVACEGALGAPGDRADLGLESYQAAAGERVRISVDVRDRFYSETRTSCRLVVRSGRSVMRWPGWGAARMARPGRDAIWRVQVPISARPRPYTIISRCRGARVDRGSLEVMPGKGRVVIVGTEAYPRDDGYSTWAVRLRNPFAAYGLRDLRLDVTLVGPVGNLITTHSETIDAVGPGEQFVIGGRSYTVSEPAASVQVRVRSVLRYPNRNRSLEVSNVRLVPPISEFSEAMLVRAEVANPNAVEVTSPKVWTILRDAAGRILDADWNYLSNLGPGERTAHETDYYGQRYLTAVSAEVFASGTFEAP
jgi:hypothetical protein